MSTSIEQLTEFLDEQEISYRKHKTDPFIVLGFDIDPGITSYRNREGKPFFAFLLRLYEDGEFLSVSLPGTWTLADCPHKAAVFETLLEFQARTKLVRFDYDPDDGEVRANAEIGIEDSLFTSKQFNRLVTGVGNAVLKLDPVIRHAMRTGEVDMKRLADIHADTEEHSRLHDLAAEAGGIEALEKLVCGDPPSAEDATDLTGGQNAG